MKTYCVKQRKKTKCLRDSDQVEPTRNGRYLLTCICDECGAKKAQFVSEEEAFGPYRRRREKKEAEKKQRKQEEIKRRNVRRAQLPLPNLFEVTDNPYLSETVRQLIEQMPRESLELPRSSKFNNLKPHLDDKALRAIERMPKKKKLELPDLTEFVSRQDLDDEALRLIGNMSKIKRTKRMKVPHMEQSDYVQKIDDKIAKLISKMPTTKPVRKSSIRQPIIPDLSTTDISPYLEQRYQNAVDKMLQARFKQLVRKSGNGLARLKGRAY